MWLNPGVFCSAEEGSGSARGQISGAVCSSWFRNSLPSAFCEQLGLCMQLPYQQYSNQTLNSRNIRTICENRSYWEVPSQKTICFGMPKTYHTSDSAGQERCIHSSAYTDTYQYQRWQEDMLGRLESNGICVCTYMYFSCKFSLLN